MYDVRVIEDKKGIIYSEPFFMNHFQWKNVYKPKAYGKMALLRDRGLYIEMTCEESDPIRNVAEDEVHVCSDSVMEVFIAFNKEEKPITNDDLYINYEMNANGKLYAKYGFGRKNRKFISKEQLKLSDCRAVVNKDTWALSVLIPKALLEEIEQWENIVNGKIFYCNFYKMSENPEIEHYASYKEIDSETPNFHLPICFGEARRI